MIFISGTLISPLNNFLVFKKFEIRLIKSLQGNPNQGLVEHLRFKRGFKKPGFFRTLFSVVYEV